MADIHISSWLGDMENASSFVLYQGDATQTPWTKLCIRQADHILLLCNDVHDPRLSSWMPLLVEAWKKRHTQVHLVRILKSYEDDDGASSLNTFSEILDSEWIAQLQNIRVPYENHHADFQRMYRKVTRKAIGVVLGGGGARGLAHVGVLRALQECGLPIDIIGGTR